MTTPPPRLMSGAEVDPGYTADDVRRVLGVGWPKKCVPLKQTEAERAALEKQIRDEITERMKR